MVLLQIKQKNKVTVGKQWLSQNNPGFKKHVFLKNIVNDGFCSKTMVPFLSVSQCGVETTDGVRP